VPSSSLGDEGRLLTRVRAAIRIGDLSEARLALEEHRARFPKGALEEERRVLSIELLLRSGDRSAAAAEASLFARDYPGSPHAAAQLSRFR
jgi:hypothetical protein